MANLNNFFGEYYTNNNNNYIEYNNYTAVLSLYYGTTSWEHTHTYIKLRFKLG